MILILHIYKYYLNERLLVIMNDSVPFVLLLTPYKVGSCYMSKILHDNNIRHARLHSYDYNERLKYSPESITHMITIERIPEHLYISAYFADIDKSQCYPYSFGDSESVAKATLSELVNYYFIQSWSIYTWLNFDYYKGWARWFQSRGILVLTLRTETLITTVPVILPTFLDIPHDCFIFDPQPSHVGHDAPNGQLYSELKKAILQEYTRRLGS